MLCASVDDQQVRISPSLECFFLTWKQTEESLSEIKSQIKMILRRLNRNSEPQASIESGAYTLQYVDIFFVKRDSDEVCGMCAGRMAHGSWH